MYGQFDITTKLEDVIPAYTYRYILILFTAKMNRFLSLIPVVVPTPTTHDGGLTAVTGAYQFICMFRSRTNVQRYSCIDHSLRRPDTIKKAISQLYSV